eukprot:1470210-Pleurochrysis_carterae.AAC.3
MGMGEGERKHGEHSGAGGVCARADVATLNARAVGKLMKISQRLYKVDERLGLVTTRPDFRSPRSPSRS